MHSVRKTILPSLKNLRFRGEMINNVYMEITYKWNEEYWEDRENTMY